MTIDLPLHRDQIMEILPHRDPMLFIDRVISLEEGVLTAESDIKPDASFFKGHFPGMPIMPGILIIETVAQAGALLAALTQDVEADKVLALVNVENVKFRRSVYPNETMRVEVRIEKIRGRFYKFKGAAYVGGALVAEPSFSAAAVSLSQD